MGQVGILVTHYLSLIYMIFIHRISYSIYRPIAR